MELPAAHTKLLQAIARDRSPPAAIQVRPWPSSGSAAAAPPHLAFRGLAVEELLLCTEAGAPDAPGGSLAAQQAWVPVRLVKQQQQQQQPASSALPPSEQSRLPVVVLLHATGSDMGSLAEQQARFARRGALAVAIDCRYHGRRGEAGAAAREGYQQALVRAWRGSGERPFLLDNVWDLQRLLDYLEQRPDVDAARIGLTGVSLGGMHAWLAAAADARVAAAAPMIGVQYFGWAVKQRRYLGRVKSIPRVFEAAAADLQAQRPRRGGPLRRLVARLSCCRVADAEEGAPQGGSSGSGGGGGEEVTPDVVAAVWDKLLPGLQEHYDAPQLLALVAPRPLLVANGELDPRCPIQGVELALERARAAYEAQGAGDQLQLFIDRGVGHECTAAMWEQAFAFMERHLLLAAQSSGAGAGEP